MKPNPTPCTIVRAALAVCVGLLPAGVAGCGYQTNNDFVTAPTGGYRWKSLYREDISTVAVPIFVNTTFARGTEFRLTSAVIQQIEARTPYKVVDREQADTVLEGEIEQVRVRTLSTDEDAVLPQEQLLQLSINFTWKDLRTGRILAQRRGFEQTATYYPTLGEGRFIGNQLAVDRIATAIVQELEADW